VIFSVGPRMASPSWHSPRTRRMRAKEIRALADEMKEAKLKQSCGGSPKITRSSPNGLRKARSEPGSFTVRPSKQPAPKTQVNIAKLPELLQRIVS
jgi:hypothetical protein